MPYIIPVEFTESQMKRLEEVHKTMQSQGNYKAELSATLSAAATVGLDELERVFILKQKKVF